MTNNSFETEQLKKVEEVWLRRRNHIKTFAAEFEQDSELGRLLKITIVYDGLFDFMKVTDLHAVKSIIGADLRIVSYKIDSATNQTVIIMQI